ncbi:MAG TPA: hypothetical protein VEN29_22820 [Casimicrobiaceae bacterium]|nr:hypothetical protein [Casimicrobiaceae bacterium]
MTFVHASRRAAPLLFFLLATVAGAQTPAREVHGFSDVFVEPEVAIAWGVLRGKDDADTKVVVRIDADLQAYALVSVSGLDPFTPLRRVLLAPTRLHPGFEFVSPRARFIDYPRTDLLFYRTPAEADANTPALTVYYLGVPDTTPEFAAESQLKDYLAKRIVSARRELRSKPQ